MILAHLLGDVTSLSYGIQAILLEHISYQTRSRIMKNVCLFCFFSIFCSLNMHAQETQKVIEINDKRNMTDEEIEIHNSKQHQKYDVEVTMIDFYDSTETYSMQFFLEEKNGTLNLNPETYFVGIGEYLDKLYYHWDGDTEILKLENSETKEHMDFEWKPTETGSSLGRTDIPEI